MLCGVGAPELSTDTHTHTPLLYIHADTLALEMVMEDEALKKSICNLNGNVMSPWWQ